jgi:hypothetical protein
MNGFILRSLTFGDRRSLGSAPTKKLAKAAAAAFMYESIPEEWKTTVTKKKKANKRSGDNVMSFITLHGILVLK